MCVRTKTSYGCGHEFKSTVDCNSSRCSGLERFHYPKGGDCRDCKRGGQTVTRGRDGKGRYALEISRRNSTEEVEVVAEDSDDFTAMHPVHEVIGGASPWAPPARREKAWDSPVRSQADRAWEMEHEKRMSDLQRRFEKFSASSETEESPVVIPSPPRYDSYRHDAAVDSHDDDYQRPRHHDAREVYVRLNVQSPEDGHHRRHHRPTHHRVRNDSYESFDSLGSTRSSSRRYKTSSSAHPGHDLYELHDSGYGSYSSRASHSYGAKTESFMTSPPRLATGRPPATNYGAYETSFGVGNGVQIISREPIYAYGSSHGRRN